MGTPDEVRSKVSFIPLLVSSRKEDHDHMPIPMSLPIKGVRGK